MQSRSRERPTETEVTLVVVSDAPEQITDTVAALSELGGFDLRLSPDQAIRDRYFDTPDGKLRAAGTALRVRDVGARRLLSIKGPARPGVRAGRTRDELEADWPYEAWALLRDELGEQLGIAAEPPSLDPVEALTRSRLVLVQDRETVRRVRPVVPSGTELAVAELAVDAVVFHLAAGDVRHHEIEIEAKAPGGDAALAALAESLLARFQPSFRPWVYGKLSTGMAAAALIEELGPDKALADDRSLLPSAYEAIAALLAGPSSETVR